MHGLAAIAVAMFAAPAAAQKIYDIEIVAAYPHDASAFTQGLFFSDGALYETTGLEGRSTLRKVNLETGQVLKQAVLPADVFGEGATRWKDRIVTLTWRDGTGYVFDLKTFKRRRTFAYAGEGWGLTSDGRRLIMSDGTPTLRFLDPETLKETGRIAATHKGAPLRDLNELEWIDGEIFANVWRTDYIVRIDPVSGAVVGVIDLRPLRASLGTAPAEDDVLNGIAFDAASKRLFVTGKNWPKLFEVRLVARK